MTVPSAALVTGWQDAARWSTNLVAPRRQFDHWRSFVNDAHMRWSIAPIRCERFPAFIRQGRHDGYRVTHLTSGPGGVVGIRGRHEIARDPDALYNLLYIVEGSICLSQGPRELHLGAGSFALWDTTRPMRFVTGNGLRQLTFAVPQAHLRRVLPRVDDYVFHKVEAGGGLSGLFADHLRTLDQRFGELPEETAGPVLRSTLDLLATTLCNEIRPAGGGDRRLRQALDYIDRHLDDPRLDAGRVARAVGVSERHLHRLFDPLGATPAAWVRRQRLEHCREELSCAASAHLSITDIALRWGFRDAGSFSKRFRREFGHCPRHLRGTARGTAAAR